ncbi:MAG TPA: protein kinase [Candidatus Dormibacteraeota bacterium]|nr:protein kinase [Candidatus Dormibacteraeota bacterium]
MLSQTISHYRITERVGAGGMGVVYKALDLTLERAVALKFLSPSLGITSWEKETLLREARAASALDHPNISVIHGIEESEEHQLFIVMAYYEGETLAKKLSRGPIPVPDSLDIAIQIARGLHAAHAHHIVHRDIKPSNIIVTNDHVVKIVDFGLARVVATNSATQSISSAGTLPYMAPEQFLGEIIDQRSDLWSLGVILVQMLTGAHPFLRPTPTAMTFAILNQAPAGIDLVSRAIQPILYRALSKKPESRYSSAEEMLHALEVARAAIASIPGAAKSTQTQVIPARALKHYAENASTPRWATSKPGKIRRLWVGSLGLAVAVLVVFFLPSIRERFVGLAYAGSEKHIVVLPFANTGGDPEYQPVADGLMDSMTNGLSNLEAAKQSLWVVPASLVREHKVSDPTTAFRELGATMVVEGAVERQGENVRLTVVLIDAKRLRQIGSFELHDVTGDLAALQDQAVTRLGRMMQVTIRETQRVPPAKVQPSVYDSYLAALGYMQRYDKPGNLDLAIAALKSAVDQDPRFAIGYATLADAYRLKFKTDHHPDWIERALANCRTAIALDSRLPAAHVTLGLLHETRTENDIALKEFQKALEINPLDANALTGMARIYESTGKISDAEANYKRAIALRPDYWEGYNALGDFYERQNRVHDAIAQFQEVIKLTPDNTSAYNDLGVAYIERSDSQSDAGAEAAFLKSIQLAPNYQAYANLGWLYMNQKRYEESALATQKALELNDKDWRVWANLHQAYIWLKDDKKMRPARAKTLSLLEQYASLNSEEARVLSLLSTYHAEDKLREKALADANAALRIAPRDPWVLADIAETHERLGDRRRAIQYARESLKEGYTFEDLRRRPALLGLLAEPSFLPRGNY